MSSTGQIKPWETFNYELPHPGPVPNRQDSPHPHQAILDPTQQYVLIPDLGADLVRIYSVDEQSGALVSRKPLQAKEASGPRHGAFTWEPISGSHIFYLLGEISATVTAYRVSYSADPEIGMLFEEINVCGTLAPGMPVPPTTTGQSVGVAAGIAVTVSFPPFLVDSFPLQISRPVRQCLSFIPTCAEFHVLPPQSYISFSRMLIIFHAHSPITNS